MKIIYDSGPYSLPFRCLAVLWACVLFVLCLALATVPFLALAQNGQQPWTQLVVLVVVLPFVSVLVCGIAAMGLSVVSPVYYGFCWRVYLNRSDIEVERAFAFHLLRQKFDRNRINCVEVIRQRGGMAIVSVLQRFDQGSPRLSDKGQIGPFASYKEAQAVADAIQAELSPENQDARQIKQIRVLEMQVVSRFVIGFLVVFELIIGLSVLTEWNRMGPIDLAAAATMAAVPLVILYGVRREIKKAGSANTGNPKA